MATCWHRLRPFRRAESTIHARRPAPAIEARTTSRSPRTLEMGGGGACIIAQRQQQLPKILRYGTFQYQSFTAARMIESQTRRMQSLTLKGAQRIDQLGRRAARLRKPAAVDRIADDGVLLMRQMQADLMSPARFELHR